MVTMHRFAICWVTLVLSISQAQAQPYDDASVASTRTTQLWEEGKARAQEGRWEEAWAAFSQAYALNPTLNIRYNLAMSAFHTKRYVQSARLMREIIEGCDATCPEKIRSTTPERLQEAEQHVARISVRTLGGARILVDGESVDQNVARKTWHVSPGAHEVVVHQGQHSATKIVKVAAGQQEIVTFDFEAPPKSPEAPSESGSTPVASLDPVSPEDDSVSTSRDASILIVGGSLTALGAGVATVFTLKARSADKEAERLRSDMGDSDDSLCVGSLRPLCDDLASANDERETSARFAKITWIVTGALGAGTLATYFLWPKQTSATALTIVPLGNQFSGLVVTGGF